MEMLATTPSRPATPRVQAATLLGTTEAFATVHDLYVERGRFLQHVRREPRQRGWR